MSTDVSAPEPRGNLLVRTTKNFLRHGDTDLAAGLTYYAVLAVFPAVLALASLLAVLGDPDDTIRTVLDVLRPVLSADRLEDVRPVIEKLANARGAGLTLAVGTVGALYSASSYVGGFSRAMNVVREVEETRPFWKLRPFLLVITLAEVLLCAVALIIITVTGPLSGSVGEKLGIGRSVLDVWDIAKWPLLALVVVIVVALLIHATPNVRTGRVRFLSPGAFLALVFWAAGSAGFAVYVANFGSYNKTYGSIAGVVVFLLWLWLTNVALLFGAELDAERDLRIEAERAAAPALAEQAARAKANSVGMFPHAPGTPVYGPREQPVPFED